MVNLIYGETGAEIFVFKNTDTSSLSDLNDEIQKDHGIPGTDQIILNQEGMLMSNESVFERYGTNQELFIFRNRYKPIDKKHDTESDTEKGMSQTKATFKMTRFELNMGKYSNEVMQIKLTELLDHMEWIKKCIEFQSKALIAMINHINLMYKSYESFYKSTVPIITQRLEHYIHMEDDLNPNQGKEQKNLMHAYEHNQPKGVRDFFNLNTVKIEKERIQELYQAHIESQKRADVIFDSIELGISNIESSFEDISELTRQFEKFEQMNSMTIPMSELRQTILNISNFINDVLFHHEKRRQILMEQNIAVVQIQHKLYLVRPDIYKHVLKRIEHHSKTLATAKHFEKLFEYGTIEVFRRTKAMQQIDYTLNELRAKYIEAIYNEHKQRNQWKESLAKLPYQISAETLEACVPGLNIRIPDETFKTYASTYPMINPNKMDIDLVKSLFDDDTSKNYIDDVYVKNTKHMVEMSLDMQTDPEELQVVMEQSIAPSRHDFKKEESESKDVIKLQHDNIMLKQQLEESQRRNRELQAQLTNADAEFLVTIDNIQNEAKVKEDRLVKAQKQLKDDSINAISISLQFAQRCLNRNAFRQDQLKTMIERYHSILTNEGIPALSQALTKDIYANGRI